MTPLGASLVGGLAGFTHENSKQLTERLHGYERRFWSELTVKEMESGVFMAAPLMPSA